jgi:2-polyprenyl-3-methyl-5-hydroxy-6-metoxy-1,4-benzoquinol methylase
MSDNPDPWAELAPLFASEDGSVEPPIGVADTMVLAWPSVIDFLVRKLGNLRAKRILNYGCGAGHFCRRLSMMGAHPVGLDTSAAMIAAARRIAAPVTVLREGGMEAVAPGEHFDAVASIMCLPFVADPDPILRAWMAHLEPTGVAVIVVFNPGFVRDLLKSGHLFKNFDNPERPRRGQLDLTGHHPMPVYIRYAEEYAYLLETHGLHLVFEARPPFTEEFLHNYPQRYPTQNPEFMVMGFERQA